MDLYDITTLQRVSPTQSTIIDSILYDLTEPTFVFLGGAPLQTTVLPEQEMRIDLVSFSIYGTTDYADLIMDLNNIDNALNIKAGDTINYISLDQLNYYRPAPNTPVQQRSILLNTNKSTQTDPNRQAFTENNYQLPPTFLQTPASPIVISQGNVTITPLI